MTLNSLQEMLTTNPAGNRRELFDGDHAVQDDVSDVDLCMSETDSLIM